MQLIRGIHNIKSLHRGCALTIGNFDGVHLGHRQILQRLKAASDQLHIPSCIMSFEPLPQEYFSPGSAPVRLQRIREKWCAMSAEDFIKDILVNKLGVKYLLTGDDFHFGQNRSGNFGTLKQAGQKYGFEVHNSPSHCYQDKRISSTRIRNALLNDRLSHAADMLGSAYQMCGRVAHGEKRGRTIGFPTANIKLHRHAAAVQGVYAVHMTGENDLSANGVANVGKRPTVDGQHLQLEVHLFDFDNDLYGQQVCVEFKQKIRDEKRFDSFDELKQQIIKDSKQAKDFFAT